jgi:flagellar basal-body rod modification protein FlgD
MSTTNNIDSGYSAVSLGAPKARVVGPNNELGKDQFLKILMTQLKNQDPMSPLQDKDFIAQMAQFTSVEQLTKISTAVQGSLAEMKALRESIGMASGLIDKQVSWLIPADANSKALAKIGQGKVEAITIRDGVQFAIVNGEEISLSRISRIGN